MFSDGGGGLQNHTPSVIAPVLKNSPGVFFIFTISFSRGVFKNFSFQMVDVSKDFNQKLHLLTFLENLQRIYTPRKAD